MDGKFDEKRDDACNILIVDDEESYCEALAMVLRTEGHRTRLCTRPTEAVGMLRAEPFDLVISDLIMPEMDGLSLLKAVKAHWRDMYFIITTAYGTIENAVEAMRQGAFTYIIKGSEPEMLLNEVARIRKLKAATSRDARAGDARADGEALSEAAAMPSDCLLSTENPEYRDILNMAEKAARSDANILILGESGSGKEVLARYIHSRSRRASLRFLPVNCYTFAESLLESELFGHEKGAFTGAAAMRKGRFEAAHGGTLFLDEICDVPAATQAKLLRAIESKRIARMGSNDEIAVDFRLISATNKSPEGEIEKGCFREDLFYRIGTIMLCVPPLRKRREDIPALARLFFEHARRSIGLRALDVDTRIEEALLEYRFPGNIRELKNIVERLVVLSDDGVIRFEDLAERISGGAEENPDGAEENPDGVPEGRYSLRELRAKVESVYIGTLLRENRNNMTETARSLGISTRHLQNKISAYGIRTESGHGEPGDA
ncbi:MAG: sigma-54 dependent transcriptional regulator [Clostridiales Family XIII bacterium]|jgi:DNA-binding NtrC family response regulator|nr:sigma-54 dependent transcriptional regulator [Clostridiales Family XIII bacterium]